MAQPRASDRFLGLLRAALQDGTLVKLTLGKYRGPDTTLKNLFVRPVTLKAGPRFAFVGRHAPRDVTKIFPADEALATLEPLIGSDFLDAHLSTSTKNVQIECERGGDARLRVVSNPRGAPPAAS